MVSTQLAQCATWRNLVALLNPRPPAASGNDVAALELGDGASGATPAMVQKQRQICSSCLEIAVLCDVLQQLLFHKFLVSHWGAKDNDSLRFNSVLVAASPRECAQGMISPQFQMRVFPWCTLILAWRHNSSRRMYVRHALATCARPQRVLEKSCRFPAATLFRDCSCNDPSKHIADHNPSDRPCGFFRAVKRPIRRT